MDGEFGRRDDVGVIFVEILSIVSSSASSLFDAPSSFSFRNKIIELLEHSMNKFILPFQDTIQLLYQATI